MIITPTDQFEVSATKYYSAMEILELENRILLDPYSGTVVPKTGGKIRRLRHPHTAWPSDRGYFPVVVYIINKPENEIIMVDVIDSIDELNELMNDPWTWLRAVSVGNALIALSKLLQ